MKRPLPLLLLALAFLLAAPFTRAQPSTDETALRSALAAQVDAWNKGDIEAFMQSYDDSPETTFIGASLNKGFRPILERYRKAYATRAQMGTLTFTDLAVRPLPSSTGLVEYAAITGRFHLERTTHGTAAKDDGIFSLLWHKTPTGWKIILDHTS